MHGKLGVRKSAEIAGLEQLVIRKTSECLLHFRTNDISASIEESDAVADRYLGQNSIPALLREQSPSADKNDRVDIRHDMRSILGLDTSAPFPLMSSKHLHRLAQDISSELPSDREVMR